MPQSKPQSNDSPLPVASHRQALLTKIAQRPVVLVAPTGTGKSTEVPLWFEGSVLMIQPRRVACRAVAARLADRLGRPLGEEVGYRVRDDDRSTAETRILVVTPGIALLDPRLIHDFETIIIDELHERRLDTDLICALLDKKKARFLAMSATLDGQRVAATYGADLLELDARTHPVRIDYDLEDDTFPTARDLPVRVARVVAALPKDAGDILVFLPGKAEISATRDALSARTHRVLMLHGGMSLVQQAEVLDVGREQRIILATNVAETSLTVPGVRVVIDSGLVRRTAYHEGRSYLTMASIANDSADQRAGRAGRTAPGRAIRLWGKRALLLPQTPPEIHRESLVPLVQNAARLGVSPEQLTFIDPPHDYALKDARERLFELGALEFDEETRAATLSERGRALCQLPLDAWLSAILVEAQRSDQLDVAIDLVAALDHPQAQTWAREAPPEELEREDCDLCACLWAMRCERRTEGPSARALDEARATAERLRRAFGLTGPRARLHESYRDVLLPIILRSDPKAAFVARSRKKGVVWSNGGTEWTLSEGSRLAPRYGQFAKRRPGEPPLENALVALSTWGVVDAKGKKKPRIVLASPVPSKLMLQQGLGTRRVARSRLVVGGSGSFELKVEVETVYAGRVLGTMEESPQGETARSALTQLFCQGRIFSRVGKEARERLARRALAADLGKRVKLAAFATCPAPPSLEEFVSTRLDELGVETGSDLQLLSDPDLLPDDVPQELLPELLQRFPSEVDLGDCLYRAEYDLDRRQVVLHLLKGRRQKAPPASYLPKFEGFSVFVEAGGTIVPVRR